MGDLFPRTQVEGLSLSRMIIGTNWMAGWSHTGPAADKMIKDRHHSHHTIVPMLEAFQENGVDTIMGVLSNPNSAHIYRGIQEVRERTGKDFVMIDTPVINVDDNPQARQEAEATIRRCGEYGAKICLLHHSSVEQLVDKNKRQIKRLDDYTKMIRDAGMIPGLSSHMPELVVYSDLNGYDVQTYIQIYNCMGFLMQSEIETVSRIIWGAKKPVMTIKPMAAGRCTPYVGLNFSWSTIRSCDMVTVGCFNENEVYEDIEISRACFEHRYPEMEVRQSPNQHQDVLKGAHS